MAAASERCFDSAISIVLKEINMSLKDQQLVALRAFLSKKDVFATLPTGYGKSLIYQLAPLVAKKMGLYANPVVVVVSPLVALMEQQVKEARKLGVIAMQLGVNSDKDLFSGQAQLLFGSPEAWLLNDKWRRLLSNLSDVVGIVVDEVHLTYKWGKSEKGKRAFRESFSRLGELRSVVRTGTPILALTASADLDSRSRVKRQLLLDNALILTESPNRSNIRLGVLHTSRPSLDCLDWIVKEIKDKGLSMSPILIYCRTLKEVGRVFSYLRAELGEGSWVDNDPDHKRENMLIGMYHSKTLTCNKSYVSSSFSGEGNCRVVVATTALGMGLNFPKISHVVMYGVPEDVEAIVQQIGRAGRDGAQAHAIIYSIKQMTEVDDTAKWLIKTSQSMCFRKALYSLFEENCLDVIPGHLCCTYCHSKCTCHPNGCKEPSPQYELPQMSDNVKKMREVTDDDRVLLRDLLQQYQQSLLQETTPLFTNKTACTGFGPELIEAVIEHSCEIFDVSYINTHLPVFQYSHAQAILEIIHEVFEDLESCPSLSPPHPDNFSPPDLFFTGYFDEEDTREASSKTSSESGVTPLQFSD